jgi:hypothetical protein
MLEHPSQIIAKSAASVAESRTVQPMLSVQVRNMGMRLLRIWFWLIPESMVVMAFCLRCGGSDMNKADVTPIAKSLILMRFGQIEDCSGMWADFDNAAEGTHW